MKFSRLLCSGFILTGLFTLPGPLRAQSEKDMIRELQRDVAQLQNQIRQSKEAQDQKNAELESLLKQSLESNGKLASQLGSLQQGLTSAIADQQGKLVQPIGAVGIKVDQLGQAIGPLQVSMEEIIRKLANHDGKLNEILNNLKTLAAAPVPPPPQGAGAATPPASGVSATGASPDVAFQAAERDFRAGRSQLAIDEFSNFIAQFPNSENAPKAQYYMGVIYDRDEDYLNAIKAYDAVLERYQENPTKRDALFSKAVALMKLDHKVEAKTEFNAFLKKYPTDEKAAQVSQYLKELNGPAHPATRTQKGKR